MNSFRDFEKSLCILRDRACINILDPGQASGANGILCYGYVDHAAGLTFEGLALVSCVDDDYTIVLGQYRTEKMRNKGKCGKI